jgi:hypothetical protein
MSMQHPTNAHAPADDSIHQDERVLDDYQLARARHLAAPADLRTGFELKRVAANLYDHPVGGRLAVLGVERLDRQ